MLLIHDASTWLFRAAAPRSVGNLGSCPGAPLGSGRPWWIGAACSASRYGLVPEDEELTKLSGEDRAFAIALIRSDHTDEELREALRWGRRATFFDPESVLGEFATGSGTLAWESAVRAALAVRDRQRRKD